MKLYVQHGKISTRHQPFHPTLHINRYSGYCENQWEEMHFRPGLFCGAECVATTTVAEAIAKYFREIKRMGYHVVEAPPE